MAPRASASGRFTVFQSQASNLLGVGLDTNGDSDIYRVDTQTGNTVRISVNTDGSPTAGGAIEPSLSADGALVAFVAPEAVMTKLHGESKAAAQRRMKAGGYGIFLRHVQTGTSGSTHHVGGALLGGNGSKPEMAAGGSAIVYSAANTDPSAGTMGQQNVYRTRLYEINDQVIVGETVCVSCQARSALGMPAGSADGPSGHAVVSADGEFVAFESQAKNLAGGNPSPCSATANYAVYLSNMLTGTTQRISPPPGLPPSNCGSAGSSKPSIDYSGLNIAFQSDQALKPGSIAGLEHVFLAQIGGTIYPRVSETASGVAGDGASTQPVIAGDGNTVAFVSVAGNLDPRFADSNGVADIHAWRVDSGSDPERLSLTTLGTQGNGPGNRPALDYNATLLVYDSTASNLVGGDTNGAADVYQRVLPANVGVVFGTGFE